jgi:DNA-directed RNA polymerase subunit K/omega
MDPLTQDKLLAKTLTKYRLVSLMQKRAVELMRGLPPLVEGTAGEIWPTITQEILTDKIQLVTGADAERLRREIAVREAEEVPALDKKDAAPAPKAEGGEKVEAAPKEEKKEG